MHKVMVGSGEVVALLDAIFLQSPNVLTPEHAEEMAEEYRDVLDERGVCTGALSCSLIKSGGGLAIVDTGIGPRTRKGFPEGPTGRSRRCWPGREARRCGHACSRRRSPVRCCSLAATRQRLST